jgi:hypothetical protein
LNPNFQTGPKIIQEVSPAAAFCHDNQYEICAVDDPRIAEILARQKGEEEEEEPVNALAIGLGVAAGIVFCCGCLYVIGKHTLTQQQLENEGKENGGEEEEEGWCHIFLFLYSVLCWMLLCYTILYYTILWRIIAQDEGMHRSSSVR